MSGTDPGAIVSSEVLEAHIARLRAEVADPRVGINGPGSMSWHIFREWGVFLGGGRAILLQLAHPFVAQAIEHHSRTRSDPLGRFQRTFDRIFAMSFGDLDRAIAAARRVHRVHRHVTGQLDHDIGGFSRGTPYAANTPEALLWVHATLLDTAVQAFELCLGPLSEADKDAYYQEQKRFAYLFGIADEIMPRDWPAFCQYMDRMLASDVIAVSPHARDMARFLFSSTRRFHRPLMEWVRVLSTGMLPARLRDEFELPYGPREERTYRASFRVIGTVYPRLPGRLRYSPAYVRIRRRLAGHPGPDRISDALEWLWNRIVDTRPGGVYSTRGS